MSQQQFYEQVQRQEEYEMEQDQNKFSQLIKLNVNDKTEQREGLTYLSWAWAWIEFKKVYPDAHYEISKTEAGLPYFESHAGAMVYTTVKAGGVTHEMWLPVMNSINKAMKAQEYEYTTKYGTKKVEAFTMFDVNKALMRCLVKNLAMFGLALYIYAGEDLPEIEESNIDITPMLNAISQAETLADLQRIYNDSINNIGDDKKLKSQINKATTERKSILSEGAEDDTN